MPDFEINISLSYTITVFIGTMKEHKTNYMNYTVYDRYDFKMAVSLNYQLTVPIRDRVLGKKYISAWTCYLQEAVSLT